MATLLIIRSYEKCIQENSFLFFRNHLITFFKIFKYLHENQYKKKDDNAIKLLESAQIEFREVKLVQEAVLKSFENLALLLLQ